MEVIVSKILYLDKDYQPCGTRVIRRPDATYHNSRVDNEYIMSVGIKAFDEREFERYPRYWVHYEGDIKDFRDMRVRNMYSIESMLVDHFRFVSLHEIDRKIGRIMEFLEFHQAHRYEEFKVHNNGWIKKNQVIVSLCDGDDDGKKFSLGDFLCSLRDGIMECNDAIETVRQQIKDRGKDMRFIMETSGAFWRGSFTHCIQVGDGYVDFEKYHKLLFSPAYNNLSKIIHDLKKRMQDLERQRSYMQHILSIIMSSTWYAN